MVCTDEMENSLSEEEPNQHVIEERCEERGWKQHRSTRGRLWHRGIYSGQIKQTKPTHKIAGLLANTHYE
jgi:IS5 family transposase